MQCNTADGADTHSSTQSNPSTLERSSSSDRNNDRQLQEINRLTKQTDELKQMLAKKEAEVLELLSYVEEIMKTTSA